MTATDRVKALRAGLIVPLVWKDTPLTATAIGAARGYVIAHDFDGWRWIRCVGREMAGVCKRPFPEKEDAKSAANSDHESIVRSALHPDLDAMLALMAEAVGALENMTDVYSAPDDLLCCSGKDCGCMGATKYQEVKYYARAVLAKIAGGAE